MRLNSQNKSAAGGIAAQIPADEMLFGRSPIMMEVRQKAEKISGPNIPVLLCGEAGTGKEILARWIHAHSCNRDGQFVKVNCAAIPGALLESELFGFEKGAFTGAQCAKPGRIELAHNGTLFLDEISDLDFSFQGKLLHFLQDGSFSRIGGDQERTINTRLICATKRNLEEAIDGGGFRADLYYRINVVRLQLARLCERREDIPQLAKYFLFAFQQKFAREAEPLSKEMYQYLQMRNWPGNIRELENCIARCVILGCKEALAVDHGEKKDHSDLGEENQDCFVLKRRTDRLRRDLEREVILKTLTSQNWNRRKAAAVMKISYRTLLYKIREAGLLPKRSRDGVPSSPTVQSSSSTSVN